MLALIMQKDQYLKKGNQKQRIQSWKEKLADVKKHWKAFSMDQAALMVIDMQNYFLDEKSHAFVPTSESILSNTQKIIDIFRLSGRPVIYTYFAVKENEKDPIGDWWGQTVKEGSHESNIIDQLKPTDDDLVIRKTSYSSFSNTSLEMFLREQQIKNLVITGVLTNLCCETTAREAFSNGFDVFMVMDATASFNEEMHLSSLLNLSYGFATPLETADILKTPVYA